MYSKQIAVSMIHPNRMIAIVLGLLFILIMPQSAYAQSGSINWSGWTFDYEIGVELDGIAIKDVKFNGNKIMERGSFPAMPVYYAGNQCGPYLDRLDDDLETVPWANNSRVVSREFRVNGEQWYELGIRQFIGQYDIYQVWYFNGDGIVDAHLFSRGLQCQVFHEHYPHWRFDFDIGDGANDQILRKTGSGLQPYTTEFNVAANQAQDHGWVVRDTATGDSVTLSLDTGRWNVDGTIVPETTYANNRVAGRLHRNGEEGWGSSGHSSLPANWNGGQGRINYGNNENINGQDIVLWYSGYLPHTASEGSGLWHSTGVRIAWSGGQNGITSYKFDFGTDSSPVESGWTRVTPNTSTDIINWSGRRVLGFDRGTASGVGALNQDIVYSNGTANLNVNTDNGTWRATMVMGDSSYGRDNMVVKAEGETINGNINSSAGQFAYVERNTPGGTQSFDVVVDDGELNIEIYDNGGGVNWSMTQLSLEKVTGSTPPPNPVSTPTPAPAPTPTPVSPPPPPPSGGSSTYEAENATISGPTIESGRGSSGGQYVDYQKGSGDYIEWTVTVSTGGAYAIGLQYANGSRAGRPMQLSVNGSAAGTPQFASTGSWSTWGAEQLTVNLNSGSNTIRLTANGNSGPNVDFLSVSGGPSGPLPPTPPSGAPQPTFTHPASSYNGVSGDTIAHRSALNVAANNSNFAVEYCIQPELGPTGQWRAVVHKGVVNRDRTFTMWLRPGDMRLHYRISTTSNWNAGRDSVSALALNQPTKVTYVRDGNKLKLYLNGVLDSEATLGGTVVSNTGSLYIGDSPWYPGMRGQIGGFAVYDQAFVPAAGSCSL